MINNWVGVRNAPLAVAANPSTHVCSVDEKTNDCLTRAGRGLNLYGRSRDERMSE